MKSIKEKSNEYADEQDLRMAYNGSCDNCRKGFVVGANYVLDEIEKCVKSSSNSRLKIDTIKQIIEQLKK